MVILPELMYCLDFVKTAGYVEQNLLLRCNKIAEYALLFILHG